MLIVVALFSIILRTFKKSYKKKKKICVTTVMCACEKLLGKTGCMCLKNSKKLFSLRMNAIYAPVNVPLHHRSQGKTALTFVLVICGCLTFVATRWTKETVSTSLLQTVTAACRYPTSWFVQRWCHLRSRLVHAICIRVYRVLMREDGEVERGGCGIGGIQLDGVGDCGE